MTIQIIRTDDGSDSLYNSNLKEIYHSKNGAIAESKHVFINAGYQQLSADINKNFILEVGFGTGLNALLTSMSSKYDKRDVEFVTLEPFVLEEDIIHKLNYGELFEEKGLEYWNKIHAAKWNSKCQIHEHFVLNKIDQKIEEVDLESDYYNLVFFDAFGPDIQPELWKVNIFSKLYKAMKKGGILVTYSAKGEVRRNLQSVGFTVSRIKGPKGKREMLRAIKETCD